MYCIFDNELLKLYKNIFDTLTKQSIPPILMFHEVAGSICAHHTARGSAYNMIGCF